VAEAPDRQELLTALTTEHFTLQGARSKQFFTFASVVAVINSVVGGSTVAIALGAILDASLGVAAAAGGVAALVSLAVLLRHADRLLEERTGRTESIFPSPASADEPGGKATVLHPGRGGLTIRPVAA
jgi:hypothetical protein